MSGKRVTLLWSAVSLLLAVSLVADCQKKPKVIKGGAVPGAIELPPDKLPPPLEDASQPSAQQALAVTFSACDTIGGDLTFFFSSPMAPEDSLATATHPAVTFTPELKGVFAWKSPQTLVFSPLAGEMTWGQTITAAIDSAVPLSGNEFRLPERWSASFEVPYFRIAGKVAGWPIYKGKPRFIAFLNWHSGQIGAGPLLLLYDQKFDPDKMLSRITAKNADGKPLAISAFRPQTVERSIDSNLTPEYCIALKVTGLPPQDSAVSLNLPSWESPDTIIMTTHDLVVNRNFNAVCWGEAAQSYYIESGEEGGAGRTGTVKKPVPLDYTWNVVFRNNFSLAILEKNIRITPAPVSMNITASSFYHSNGGMNYPGAELQFTLKPGTTYKLTIPKTFCDILGNPLREQVATWFRSVDLPPGMELAAEPIVVEKNQNTIPFRARNIRSLTARIFRYANAEEYAAALLSGKQKNFKKYGIAGKIDTLSFSYASASPNIWENVDLPLGGHDGLMCVEVTAAGTGSEARGPLTDAILVQRTNAAVTAKMLENKIFVWMTRLDNGQPLPGAALRLFAGKKLIAADTTDAGGTALLAATGVSTEFSLNRPVAIVAAYAGDTAVAAFSGEQLAQPWQFGLKGATEGYRPLYASVFTERGAYRPGDTVRVKIIAGRTADSARRNVTIDIRDCRGQQVVSQKKALDAFCSADLSVPVKEEAPVGEYSIHVSEGKKSANARFLVEEYRVPTFKVAVTSEKKEWRLGEDINGIITAKYLHGGTLDGREVRWDVLRQPSPFSPRGYEKYAFSIGDIMQVTGSVESGSKRLDGQGRTLVRFQPNHSSAMGPMLYTVEATVTDVDRQAYAGRISKVVHPADFYIGVKPPPREVVKAGEQISVPIVTLGPDGTVMSGVKIQAVIERIDYHTAARLASSGSVDMLNRPVPIPVDYQEITSRGTAVPYTLSLPSAGVFRARFWAKDARGRLVQSGFTVTATGGNVTAWPRFDQDIIEITTDKQEYVPGETAKLVAQSPFEKASGLVTIEREGQIECIPFVINKNTPAVSVPILDSYAPNVFVSVMLVRGRVHAEKDASGFETGAPGFKIGYVNLKVSPRDKKLTVTATPSRTVAQPGSTVKVAFSVQDFEAKPTESRITCMVVDEAVLGLTNFKTPNPLETIFAERLLGVRTGTSLLDLPHARRSRLEKIFPSGDQDKTGATLEYSEALRKLFKSTAYWNPNISVGPDGRASIEFELPDNLTTYRIMAVVVDKKGRVGSADRQVTVKKPLMTQPVLPRFAYPDDRFVVEALVYNGTDAPGDVTVKCECTGMKLTDASAVRTASVAANGSVMVPFNVTVLEKGKATIRFSSVMGNAKDAVEVGLPVLEPGNRRTDVQSQIVSAVGDLQVTVPAERLPGSVRMEVVASSSSLSELKDAVQYLMGYPNGCIEQTTSTAYPLVVLKDLLPEIGVEVNMAELKQFSEAGVRRILSFQTPAGGLAYWPDSKEPHAFATAFGLTALIAAKERGYDVPDAALKGMADYLESSLRQGTITGEMPHGSMADGDTRALFVMTLGRLGRPQPGYISSLWNKKTSLTPFGLSFLAIAVREMPGDQSLLAPVLEEIKKAAKQDQDEAWYEGKPSGGWSMDSPLRTHAAALLASAESGDEITGKYLSGLLKRRQYGMWGNTQENVFGIMGVHAAATRKMGGEGPSMLLTVNGKTITPEMMEKNSPQVRRLALAENELGLVKGQTGVQKILLEKTAGPPIYLTTRLQYDVPLTEENRKSLSQGFTIRRTYTTLEGKPLEGKPIKLGMLVRVRLSLTVPTVYHYVALDDKLPAGLEALNSSLATTERVAQGSFTPLEQRSQSVLSYSEIRDSRVAFFIDEMLAGEYEYSYVARATTRGTFLRPAARAEAMYQPENFGATSIDNVIIEPEK